MNLQSLRVLVMRPKPQGAILCEKIQAAGGNPVYLPTIEIAPPDDSGAFLEHIKTLDEYEWLIFISPQAVMQSAAIIHAHWPHFLEKIKIAAVGLGTATALRDAKLPVSIFPSEEWNSEGILDLAEFKQISGKKIAIICGQGGRELLADTLVARGALVTLLIAYQRKLPEININEYTHLFHTAAIDIIVCTSNESLQNLLTLAGEKSLADLQVIPILVASGRIAANAKALGFDRIILAKNASNDCILDALDKQKGLLMENKRDAQVNKPVSSPHAKKQFPWASIGIVFSTFAVIVLIAVFLVSFYKISYLGKQLQNNLFTLQQRMDAQQASLETFRQDTQQATESLKQAIADVRQAQSVDKNAWRITEAQYYVKLASTNLLIENNVPIAIQLLQTADKEIQNINDPKYDALRKALADDIVSLQNVPHVDYTGIYMRLSALNSQVDKLPMIVRQAEKSLASSDSVPSEVWWKRGLSETWQTLQKIIVIRYHQEGVPPLTTPNQQDFLLQNVHAAFEKAMWAVLNKNPDIYHASLQQVSQWINKYFVDNDPVTQNMVSNLNQLQQIDVNPATPKITASLQAFDGVQS